MTKAGERRKARAYWRRNVRYLAILLSIWAAVSFGAGVIFADVLNHVRIPGTGFKLGFWFAQQGSIYVFLALIAVYVWLMNRLDLEMGVEERPRVAVLTPAADDVEDRGGADSSRGGAA